ncbi:DUF421 domain-containing protein [Mycolicibacterium baixiangningiae]|uniref:DUF421 domain-containing protein n=1 Tax=Mycolicibacterium baixiangningiae TaxID=2761578 RepID=UPI0018D0A20E|nr:YetF domain-containing protein [Mycolicibacterium baixiangningiae]
MWFDAFSDVMRVVAAGAAAYVALVLVLRLSGKRTLAKLNAFDLVITVALGSTLATILLNADVSIAEGVAALALLTALQFVAAIVSSRIKAGRALLTSRPTALVTNGRVDEHALRAQRVSPDEVRQAIRSSGHGDVRTIAAVVLESDGSLSVIAREQIGDGSALAGVDRVETPR